MDSPITDDIVELHELHKKGRLHRKLIRRLFIMGVLAILFGAIAIYDTLSTNLRWYTALGGFSIGLVVGGFLFKRIYTAFWDEEKQVVIAGKIDRIGFLLFGIYFLSRILIEVVLRYFWHDVHVVSGIAFAVFSGIMFARFHALVKAVRLSHRK
jgi:hypothetical protein